MEPVALRLARLLDIARLVRDSGDGLALLALGSAADTARLDEWSDLDFFAVMRPGTKARYIDTIDWLAGAGPILWGFRNTADGWKALYADGVFLEFAVFEPAELATIPFAPGRLVWQAEGFDASVCTPRQAGGHPPAGQDYLVGEILSNLYVGLCRWRRGERLAAYRAVQQHAVDNLLRLNEQLATPDTAGRDPFNLDRRLEQRHPALAADLPALLPGLERTPEAALAILDWVECRLPVPVPMADAIRRLGA